jgi:hypothetical protein
MDDRRIVEVELKLWFERGADPPRGTVSSAGVSHPFVGWLGLATALERVLEDSVGRSVAPVPRRSALP